MLKTKLKEYINRVIRNSKTINEIKKNVEDRFLIQKEEFLVQLDYIHNYETLKKNKVVYSCVTGNYDSIPLYRYLNPDWDYVLFTDNEEILKFKNYGGWKVRKISHFENDNTKTNRWYKLHPNILFPEYDESIYIDANIFINAKDFFDEIEEKSVNHTILIPRHPFLDCIYKEIDRVLVEVCGIEKRADPEPVKKMKEFLEKENFPKNYGLNENNIIYRRHNDEKVIKIMDEWWFFLENYSSRDQCSLSYVLWKNNIKPEDIYLTNVRNMKGMELITHTSFKK